MDLHLHLSVSPIQPFILCPVIESLCCLSSFLNAHSNSACMGWMLVYVPSLRIYSLKFSFLFPLHIHKAFSLVQHSCMQGHWIMPPVSFSCISFFSPHFLYFPPHIWELASPVWLSKGLGPSLLSRPGFPCLSSYCLLRSGALSPGTQDSLMPLLLSRLYSVKQLMLGLNSLAGNPNYWLRWAHGRSRLVLNPARFADCDSADPLSAWVRGGSVPFCGSVMAGLVGPQLRNVKKALEIYPDGGSTDWM